MAQTKLSGLTHEQAITLKACAAHGVPEGHWPGLSELVALKLIEGYESDSWGFRSTSYGISPLGRHMLEVYDAEWCVVKREAVGKLFSEATGLMSRGTSDEAIKEMME